jgi:hypothetical protein
MAHFIGRSGAHLESIASSYDSETGRYGGELRVQLLLKSGSSNVFFAQLESQKAGIERDMGEPLVWYAPPDARTRRIYVRRSGDISERDRWPEYHAWLKEKLESFDRVFRPRVGTLQA